MVKIRISDEIVETQTLSKKNYDSYIICNIENGFVVWKTESPLN